MINLTFLDEDFCFSCGLYTLISQCDQNFCRIIQYIWVIIWMIMFCIFIVRRKIVFKNVILNLHSWRNGVTEFYSHRRKILFSEGLVISFLSIFEHLIFAVGNANLSVINFVLFIQRLVRICLTLLTLSVVITWVQVLQSLKMKQLSNKTFNYANLIFASVYTLINIGVTIMAAIFPQQAIVISLVFTTALAAITFPIVVLLVYCGIKIYLDIRANSKTNALTKRVSIFVFGIISTLVVMCTFIFLLLFPHNIIYYKISLPIANGSMVIYVAIIGFGLSSPTLPKNEAESERSSIDDTYSKK